MATATEEKAVNTEEVQEQQQQREQGKQEAIGEEETHTREQAPPPPSVEPSEEQTPQLPPRPVAPLQALPPPHAKALPQPPPGQAPLPGQYGQYPPAQGFQQPPLGTVPVDRNWHIFKLALETLSVIASVVIFGIGIALVVLVWESDDYYIYGTLDFGLAGTAAGLALIWTVCDFLNMAFTSDRRSCHPGAHVGFHLVIWLVALAAVAFISIFVQYMPGDFGYSSSALDMPVEYYIYQQVLLGFTAVLLLIHFIMFWRACVETHRVNRLHRQRVVYVPVAVAAYGSPHGYYYGPQQFPTVLQAQPGMQQQQQFPYPPQMMVPPQMMMNQTPQMMQQQQMQMAQRESVTPQQAQLYGGFYAPVAPPQAHQQPQNNRNSQPPQELPYGYYAPAVPQNGGPPAPQRRESRVPTVASGSGSRRSSGTVAPAAPLAAPATQTTSSGSGTQA
ncbi:hypothetical protein QBC46DRAFT_397236 [Diplogelasinospora grovesii]|uniref:Uncharacterized protein n=1 Tax=Diplogelasinospora grovesii TaxID=303347 RepID=A0AAN6MY97_9PEZI|nr:hypothetical protein QBC46DRAFT_397236 [Diplogelasinospora grovesii]